MSNLAATHHGTAVTATWDAPAGTEHYHITYSSDGGASWSLADARQPAVPSPTIRINGVDSAKSYIVGVRAGNARGWSGWRNSGSASYSPPPVAQGQQGQGQSNHVDAPSNPTASQTGLTLAAAWVPSTTSGVVYQGLEYSCNGGGHWYNLAYATDNTTRALSRFGPPFFTSPDLDCQVRIKACKNTNGTECSAWAPAVVTRVAPTEALFARCDADVCIGHDVRMPKRDHDGDAFTPDQRVASDRWVKVPTANRNNQPPCKKSVHGHWT